MNVWGIHMGEHVGSAPIENNFVGIGWGEMGDLRLLDKDRECFKSKLSETSPNAKPGAIPVQAGVLYRFIHEIKEDDIIIYPSKIDRMVNIGRCKSEYIYIEDDEYMYPNHRLVDWLLHIPRDELPQAALNEIGSALTLFLVKSHADVFLSKIGIATNGIEKLLTSETEDDDTATDEVARKASETAQDFIIRIIKNQLNPFQFESFVAHVLECMGYSARVTEKSGDGGVDVIAHRDELGFEPPIIKVQCKQITSQSSEPDVSRLLGTLGDGEFALFVNLGSYSKPARILERNKSKLRLIDGEQLVELILEHYENLSPRYRTLIPMKQIYVPDL